MRTLKLVILVAVLIGAAMAPQTNAAFPCPTEPIVTCYECIYFGQPSTYRCTLRCQDGVPKSSCVPCGWGCDP
jgi:hypothetical protein